ncbi:MAG: hypothetical protein JXB23_18155 [Candidatus Aminicenantes bacterium]|nr:hypothetical protein [Candidatus Aminicenantes bacterium]
MFLTLEQFLFLVITIAVVVAVTFIVLFLIQLRKTAKEGEKTLIEITSLAKSLQETSDKVGTRIEDLDSVMKTAKQAAIGLAEITLLLTARSIRPTAKYWPLLFPLYRIGRQLLKKRKEDKNGK